MAANKYLSQSSGIITEVIPATAGGGGSANQIPALDGSGLLASTMMPVGIGPDIVSIPSSENLAAGALVNIYSNGGVATARNADNSAAGKEANGFVLAAVTSPATAAVYLGGPNTAVTGLSPGVVHFLGTVGAAITAPPSGAGKVAQVVGRCAGAAILAFQPGPAITLAS